MPRSRIVKSAKYAVAALYQMNKTAFYVDGFNLYHAIDALHNDRLKWLDLWKLASTFLRADEELDRVVYFTALMKWDHQKLMRHKEYLRALESVGVECIVSEFQKSTRHCKEQQRHCEFHGEKKTDVGIATRILCDCFADGISRVILLTADSDQVPTIAAVRGVFPQLSVSIACPPGRGKIARELCSVAHDHREVTPGRLDQCLFPRNVVNSSGKVVARSPAKYQPNRLGGQASISIKSLHGAAGF